MNATVTEQVERLIPATPPAYGQETAQLILDIIRNFPELHDQSIYGPSGNSYGTAHCIAGWARVIHGNQLPWNTTRRVGEISLGITPLDEIWLFSAMIREARAVHALEYLAKGERIDWAAVWPDRPTVNDA